MKIIHPKTYATFVPVLIIYILKRYDENADDPPTYVCVGDSDGIANWRTMQRRLQGMAALGIPTEFHVYPGLGHGFGLGTGTVAEGWIYDAIRFWDKQ